MRRFFIVLGLAALLFVSACLPESHVWHQKLTLVVETPAGPISGSSVTKISVSYYEDPPLQIGNEVVYTKTGEAAVVEVLPGRYLFALLGGDEGRFYAATKDRFSGMRRGEWLREIPKQTDPAELFPDHMPMLVTFGDINDPASVMEVDPTDLAASFGPGVRLISARLEITDEPVTKGKVEQMLGWLGEHPEPTLARSDNIFNPTHFGSSIRHGDFIRR